MKKIYHSHNTNEHERIMDTAIAIRTAIDDLYTNHHNGNVQLNNRIKVLDKYANEIITRLEMHVESTTDVDSIIKHWNIISKIGRWILGIGTTVLIGWLSMKAKMF